ncbi:rhamnosyltransferase [Spirochaetia bacterium]|nr:rhamnosyltransferase [Spirochaetia bacterium]
MHISIIGTAGIPAKYGGFETLAENLVKNKTDGIEYTVFCSSKLYQEKMESYLNAKLRYINLSANDMSSIFYDLICMLLSLHSDVMLILGVSGSLFLPLIRLMYRGKIITNIDGIEWKRPKWNKLAKFILHVSEKAAVNVSDIVIGDNQIIIDYIIKEYKKESVLLEYGGDHARIIHNDDILLNEYGLCPHEYCCMFCRIEPENNIELILEAFSKTPSEKLLMAGRWETSEFGRNIREKYKHFDNLILLDAIYDQTKVSLLRSNCKLYIHGHSVGGTNPSLVEAMCAGLPVAAFDVSYNRSTTENKSLYFNDIDSLKKILTELDLSGIEQIARDMKEIADRRYTWNIITQKYESLYF